MDIQQLQIRDASSAEDVREVERVLLSAASRFMLADNTSTSRVPHTIRSYTERRGGGFGLGARVVRDLVVVDFNLRSEPSPDFPGVVEHIHAELHRIFGDQVHLPGAAEHIPVYDNAVLPCAAEIEVAGVARVAKPHTFMKAIILILSLLLNISCLAADGPLASVDSSRIRAIALTSIAAKYPEVTSSKLVFDSIQYSMSASNAEVISVTYQLPSSAETKDQKTESVQSVTTKTETITVRMSISGKVEHVSKGTSTRMSTKQLTKPN